jgi:hypothetical protein
MISISNLLKHYWKNMKDQITLRLSPEQVKALFTTLTPVWVKSAIPDLEKFNETYRFTVKGGSYTLDPFFERMVRSKAIRSYLTFHSQLLNYKFTQVIDNNGDTSIWVMDGNYVEVDSPHKPLNDRPLVDIIIHGN